MHSPGPLRRAAPVRPGGRARALSEPPLFQVDANFVVGSNDTFPASTLGVESTDGDAALRVGSAEPAMAAESRISISANRSQVGAGINIILGTASSQPY
eukprot:SAG11_NODE_974_length_6334_cov_29.611387_4_plen_99_part_00